MGRVSRCVMNDNLGFDDFLGNPLDITKFDEKLNRYCKLDICNKKLSIYNPNDYCFAHVHIGTLKESDEAANSGYGKTINRKDLRNYKKRAKAVHGKKTNKTRLT